MTYQFDHLKLIATDDGSFTIFNEDLNETYHSRHGAKSESECVYIKNGLNLLKQKNISILEIGFGTGLNAYLTYQANLNLNKNINYTALEPYKLKQIVIDHIYNSKNFDLDIINKLHASHDEYNELKSNFKIKVLEKSLQDFISPQKFDLIYFDAFAPKIQPELWHIDILKQCYDLLNQNGILTTYCAQGQFKRNLKSIGFEVINPKGPNGKREITVAIKS